MVYKKNKRSVICDTSTTVQPVFLFVRPSRHTSLTIQGGGWVTIPLIDPFSLSISLCHSILPQWFKLHISLSPFALSALALVVRTRSSQPPTDLCIKYKDWREFISPSGQSQAKYGNYHCKPMKDLLLLTRTICLLCLDFNFNQFLLAFCA